MLTLKCADLSHASADLRVHRAWAARLEEEVWRQGDSEAALGMPPTPLFDRKQPDKGLQTTQARAFAGGRVCCCGAAAIAP